ncbi:MAG: ABC transporter ATP-binding protein [Coriobacteriales bacterium]|jgi:sulfate transport system ATP-binding protein|nr:ABC transporter ATP-binding protein [Coriobacteriales bacterium]
MYVELQNIHKSFGDFKASDNISFSIAKGSLVGLLGPSGSGKTTILRIIAGLEQPDSGNIIIDGTRVNDIKPARRGIGFVFQNYALFRYMSVQDNIAFGLETQKKDKAFIRERVAELIELMGLKGTEKRYPHQISGGQKQRVAFARALAPNPHLLLLDEPFAAVDAKVRKELRSWLRETINEVGITSIFVTHDQDEAIEVADRLIISNNGRIEQIGSPVEIYQNPRTPFVAQFIGQPFIINRYDEIKGFARETGFEKALIRPEFVRVTAKDEQALYSETTQEGIVEAVYFRGDSFELHIRLGDERIAAHRPLEEKALETGEVVDVLVYRLYLINDREVKLVESPVLSLDEEVVI